MNPAVLRTLLRAKSGRLTASLLDSIRSQLFHLRFSFDVWRR